MPLFRPLSLILKGLTASGSLDPHKQCYVLTKELCGIRLADFAKTELFWISLMTLAKRVLLLTRNNW